MLPSASPLYTVPRMSPAHEFSKAGESDPACTSSHTTFHHHATAATGTTGIPTAAASSMEKYPGQLALCTVITEKFYFASYNAFCMFEVPDEAVVIDTKPKQMSAIILPMSGEQPCAVNRLFGRKNAFGTCVPVSKYILASMVRRYSSLAEVDRCLRSFNNTQKNVLQDGRMEELLIERLQVVAKAG